MWGLRYVKNVSGVEGDRFSLPHAHHQLQMSVSNPLKMQAPPKQSLPGAFFDRAGIETICPFSFSFMMDPELFWHIKALSGNEANGLNDRGGSSGMAA